MGNGYHHHHHIRNGSSNSFFLPMVCKLSIKDVNLHNNSKEYPSSSNIYTHNNNNQNEPSSPKISCMGQVKRNNRVIGFPTPYRPIYSSTAITGPLNPKLKYTKSKKLFSGKIFTAGNNSVTVVNSRKESSKIEVNVCELDPPLPVVKTVKRAAVDGGLWKRRSGGATLKSLKIQQIHLSRDNNLMQPTTV